MQQMSLFFFSSILSRQFEIVPEDDPQNAIVASSALTCHSNLLKAVASVRYRRQQPTSCCGWKTVSRVLLIKSTFCLSCPPLSSKCVTPIVPSGADFFGFSHPTIQNLIQSCPGARKCTKYVKQNRENVDAFNIWRFRNYLCFRMFIFLFFNSYRWIRFEVCRPGDGQIPHSLSEDDASVNFEAYQRHQCFDKNVKTEHGTGYRV